MNVTVHTNVVPPEVEPLCALPDASFFHSPRWFAAVIAAHPAWRSGALVARDAARVVQGAIPFVQASRFGLRRVYAGPWGTYGGIVARTPDATQALTAALRQFASAASVAVVRIHDFAGVGTAGVATARHWTHFEERCQVLDLGSDPRALFHDACTAKNRNKIRKAEKRGIRVRCARDAQALQTYARLYRASIGRRAAHATPLALFTALADAGDAVQVWLAERDGQPVAALLNLRCGGQIMNWGNVSLPESWPDAPNNLLHWRALESACGDAAGPRLYNFGSSAGLPGVHTFKASFGAREHVYDRLEYVAPWMAWWRRSRGA